jgi:nucleoside-diphosphate-sugar epimerase
VKRILITGATGFIGRNVAAQLIEEGEIVRALVRDPENLVPFIRKHAEIVVGDMGQGECAERAMRNVDTVLHLAALARAWGPAEEFWSVNVRSVGCLLRAAHEAGANTFVHTSTVLGLPPYLPAEVSGDALRLTAYEETKRAAEDVLRAYSGSGMSIVIVRPTRVYGPGPLSDANGVTKLVDLFLRGRFRLRISDGDVKANYVHVADVADGIIRAGRCGHPGGDYLLGGDNVSLRGLLEMVARLAGVRRRVFALPATAAMAVGRAGEIWGALGGSPSLTRRWIRVFLEDRRADSSRARNELGYAPRALETGLRETIAWLRGEGSFNRLAASPTALSSRYGSPDGRHELEGSRP